MRLHEAIRRSVCVFIALTGNTGMSRLSRKPIFLPVGCTVKEMKEALVFSGVKGEIQVPLLPHITLQVREASVSVETKNDSRQARTNLGTMASLIQNALQGLVQGFQKVLEIEGVGYRASLDGNTLLLYVGRTNPVRFEPPPGISVTVSKNIITVSGVHKESVGQTAARIRSFKKPEPYKGKGIRYQGEVIRRKAGKKAVTTKT